MYMGNMTYPWRARRDLRIYPDPGDDRLLVILNFSTELPGIQFDSEDVAFKNAEQLLISNYKIDFPQGIRQIMLRPYQAAAIRLS